jgi:hypothetical protein
MEKYHNTLVTEGECLFLNDFQRNINGRNRKVIELDRFNFQMQ